MARLEDLTRGASVKGILPDSLVTVVDVKWHGSAVVDSPIKMLPVVSGKNCFIVIVNPLSKSFLLEGHGALTVTVAF